MDLAFEAIGVLACAAAIYWLWRRYGMEVAVGTTLGFFGVVALVETLLRPRRDLQADLDEGILPFPSEAKRKELAEALKSAEARLVEARRAGGVEGLKAELKANRLEREGEDQ